MVAIAIREMTVIARASRIPVRPIRGGLMRALERAPVRWGPVSPVFDFTPDVPRRQESTERAPELPVWATYRRPSPAEARPDTSASYHAV
ncbi:MAG: hypothetical protein ACTHKL_22685, partial [Streptosporangiaceae bacterium]